MCLTIRRELLSRDASQVPGSENSNACWRESEQSAAGRRLIVDLTGVTFVEQEGKALLTRMCQAGADLLATGCCMRSIVEDAKKQVR